MCYRAHLPQQAHMKGARLLGPRYQAFGDVVEAGRDRRRAGLLPRCGDGGEGLRSSRGQTTV
jgi:hypothetical protein